MNLFFGNCSRNIRENLVHYGPYRGTRCKDKGITAFVVSFRIKQGRSPNFPEMKAAFPDAARTTLRRYAMAKSPQHIMVSTPPKLTLLPG